MTNPTPSPWAVEENTEAGGIIHLAVTNRSAGKEWMVCSVTPQHLAREIDQSNARLISAAPDLLQALEMAVATIERLQRHAPNSAIGTLGVADAAIAKAKGKV